MKREQPSLGNAIEQRGTSFIQKLYQQDLSPIFATWGSHREDFEWVEKSVIYGLFLSDHSVLSEVESELVILTSIMCQGLKAPTIWHLRGLRRLGVSNEIIDKVTQAVRTISEYCGKHPREWATIQDVPQS